MIATDKSLTRNIIAYRLTQKAITSNVDEWMNELFIYLLVNTQTTHTEIERKNTIVSTGHQGRRMHNNHLTTRLASNTQRNKRVT